MRRTRLAVIATAVAAGLVSVTARAATVGWTGTNGPDWGTGSNWNNATGPGPGDTAAFGDTGSINQPNEVTSILDATRTIGGLSVTNTLGKFHTLDLGTHTLNVGGNLSFNLDQGANTTTTIRNGSLNVNSPFAAVSVGRGVVGSSTSFADLSGVSSFTSNTQNFFVGTSTAGTASGTLWLGPSSNITAGLIQVGASRGSSGTLHLGRGANVIQAAQWDIARDDANGTVDVASGGSVSIGTAAQRTSLQIANQNSNTNVSYFGPLNLGTAAVNLRLDSLVVAQKTGGSGATFGTLNGGGSGSVVIGDPAARGAITIGNTITGGSTNGTVDFSRLSTMQAHVNDVTIALGSGGGATGTLALAANSTVDASGTILVGAGGGATLTAGAGTTTLLANSLQIGRDHSNATLLAPAGATVNLGSPARRVSLSLANSSANTNETYTAKIDATGATINAYLSGLIVGQRTSGGGGGTTTGRIFGATGGTVDIGTSGTNTANVIIGNNAAGVGPASGSVDFGGLASFTASLNTLSLGTSPNSSGTQGSLILAASNSINANSVVVGSNGGGFSSITLGQNNTILANQLTIAKDFASGSMTLPANGTLNLGAPEKRTNVSIATGTTNTLNTYLGTLDCSAGTLVAYLDQVVVGDKNPQPGGENGTISISSRAGNRVEANSIALGGTNSTGTINFAGGQLFAGTITGGAGTANFNWTGGALSVGTFGSPTRAFNLSNASTGTLAPGSATAAIGTTQVYGNYVQSTAATTALQIAGASPGTGNDLLNVSGSATFAGTLSLDLINGFTPAAGQNILLANYASRSGTYAFVDPPTGMPQNVGFELDYTTTPTQLMMRMVAPTAQSWISTASQGTWSVGGNWSGGTAPVTSTAASINNGTGGPQTVTVASSTTTHRVTLQGGSGAPLNLEVLQGVRFGIANELVVGNNAAVTGGGQILGNLNVLGGGSIAPGPGVATLAVDGNLNASGRLEIQVGGGPASGAFDALDVSGSARLGGAITLSNINGYVPATTDVFPVLTYGSRSGRFDSLALTASAPRQSYSLHYAADRVSALSGEWDSPADIGGEFDVPGSLRLSGDWNWSGLLVKRGAGTLVLNLDDDVTTASDAALAIVSGTFRLEGENALVLSDLSFGDLGELTGDPSLNGTFGFYYASVSAVPEPAGLAAVSLLAPVCLARRIRRRRA